MGLEMGVRARARVRVRVRVGVRVNLVRGLLGQPSDEVDAG